MIEEVYHWKPITVGDFREELYGRKTLLLKDNFSFDDIQRAFQSLYCQKRLTPEYMFLNWDDYRRICSELRRNRWYYITNKHGFMYPIEQCSGEINKIVSFVNGNDIIFSHL